MRQPAAMGQQMVPLCFIAVYLVSPVLCICDTGWIENDLYCYHLSNTTLTQRKAQDQCQMYSSSLASLDHPNDNDFVYRQISSGEDSFWIGYTRVTPTIWRWVSTGTVGSYFNWDLGEPDNEGSCAQITPFNLGKWRDRDCNRNHRFVCKKLADCGEPTAVPNSDMVTSRTPLISASNSTFYPEGTVARFVCNEGYEFENSSPDKYVSCTIGGQWESRVGEALLTECVLKVCTAPPVIENTITNGTYDQMYKFGTIIAYACQQNFWFSPYEQGETKFAVCTDQKTWSSDGLRDCSAITCIRPITTYALSNTSSNKEGTVAHYTCARGYRFEDNSTEKVFKCGEVGWEPAPMLCKIKTCPVHSVSGAQGTPNSTDYDTTVIWRCDSGRTYDDTSVYKSMYCQDNEQWDKLVTDSCERKKCEDSPSNNTETRTHNWSSNVTYRYGDTIMYTCAEGMFFVDVDAPTQRSAMCNEDAEWTPQLMPECVETKIEVKVAHFHVPKETENAKIYGSVGIIMVGVVLGFILFLDLTTCAKHCIVLKMNLCNNSMDPEEKEKIKEQLRKKKKLKPNEKLKKLTVIYTKSRNGEEDKGESSQLVVQEVNEDELEQGIMADAKSKCDAEPQKGHVAVVHEGARSSTHKASKKHKMKKTKSRKFGKLQTS